uniref:Putative secreted protein n=1 Tax=Anopheles darlingi TaxID=43151 RepID=A0A2M4DA69_ANODA
MMFASPRSITTRLSCGVHFAVLALFWQPCISSCCCSCSFVSPFSVTSALRWSTSCAVCRSSICCVSMVNSSSGGIGVFLALTEAKSAAHEYSISSGSSPRMAIAVAVAGNSALTSTVRTGSKSFPSGVNQISGSS